MSTQHSIFEWTAWIFGATSVVAFCISLYFRHRDSLKAKDAAHQITQLREHLLAAQKGRAEFARTVYDLCFQSLLHTRNQSHDLEGRKLQVQWLLSAVNSIQRLAQDFSDRLVLQGQLVGGAELADIE